MRKKSVFRSEEMALCQLFLQSDTAYSCVAALGEIGLVQFRDLNSEINAFQRKFVDEVRRCEEMERKLNYLEKEIKKDSIPIYDKDENPKAPLPRQMVDLEATFEKLENELREVNKNAEALERSFLELTEIKHILHKTQIFFDEAEGFKPRQKIAKRDKQTLTSRGDENVTLLGDEAFKTEGQAIKLGFVAGVVLRERLSGFERMLWRVCHGNVLLRQAEIVNPLQDPSSGDKVFKNVFILFFQGDRLKSRVKKICEGFHATLYPCPESPTDRREMAMGVITRIEDLNTVMKQTQNHRHRVLVAVAKNIKNWSIKVRKIKAIYHTLNFFNLDVTQKCLIGECWVPVGDLEEIQSTLKQTTDQSGSNVPGILNQIETQEKPPTYNPTNKFTHGFQVLIDSYGVALYREINPNPYTIITFPFLFGVMFGDIGHGLIMVLFASWMVIYEKKIAKRKSLGEIAKIFFGGRYVILLMGLFSCHAGLIYNDIFSKSINIFGSYWKPNYTASEISTLLRNNKEIQLNPSTAYFWQYPYPFGIDPIWQVSRNKIYVHNSFKMKLSIIFGVAHMLFGLSLSFINFRFFKKKINIIFEFIPQILFFCVLFLYMVVLMFIKWIKYKATDDANEVAVSPRCAPYILITFINMMLFKDDGRVKAVECTESFYKGQYSIQIVFIAISVCCIPILLLGIPIYKTIQLRKLKKLKAKQLNDNDINNVENAVNGHEDGVEDEEKNYDPEHLPIGELFIHQTIHTIEFILGTISHTASYLRLWALSLAHAQLSEVLWTMVISKTIRTMGYAFFFIFGAWALLTISILVVMEGLSAFLHTLRLHWVEFQSKFYIGGGVLFRPLDFKKLIEESSDSDIKRKEPKKVLDK